MIGRYLRAGVELPDGSRESTPLGVPQGGPLSPLLFALCEDLLVRRLQRLLPVQDILRACADDLAVV